MKKIKLLSMRIQNFKGSGSTGVACVNTERKFIGFELDSHFYEIAQERIMTTKK